MFADGDLEKEIRSVIRAVVTTKFANENIRRIQVRQESQAGSPTLLWEAVVGKEQIGDHLILATIRSQAQMQIRLSVAYHLSKVTRPDYGYLLEAERAHRVKPGASLLRAMVLVRWRDFIDDATWNRRKNRPG